MNQFNDTYLHKLISKPIFFCEPEEGREKRGLLRYLSAHKKIQTLLRTNHITGFVTVPSEKKIIKNYHLAKSENSLQNPDNLLQLKILLDILP